MRDFGYIKLGSYFYFLNLIIGYAYSFDKNPYLNLGLYFFFVLICYYLMQMIFYKKMNVKNYGEMFGKSVKDIFMITVVFLIINACVTLGIDIGFYIISKEVAFGFDVLSYFANFFPGFIVFLILVNYLYYKTFHSRKYDYDAKLQADLDIETVPQELTMTTKIKAETVIEQTIVSQETESNQKEKDA